MYEQLLYEVWEQYKMNRKGKTTVTNFDKVKEMMDIEEVANYYNLLCKTIYKLQGKEYCYCNCDKCYEWLKQEYKEPPKPILTDKEREYLSAVIKPFKSDVQIIKKMETTYDTEDSEVYIPKEYIVIITKEFDNAVLPCFEKGKYYKGMETTDGYTLEELGL